MLVLPHCFRALCDLAVIALDRDGGTWHRAFMGIGGPKDLTECRRFFVEPESPKQRQYEALRAYFVENRPSKEVAETFGYSPGAFRVLCHHFRRESDPRFFVYPQNGPSSQPKKSAARQLAIALRKQNHTLPRPISLRLRTRPSRLSIKSVRGATY